MIEATFKNVLAVNGIKATQLSEILGCSIPTAQKKIKEPNNLTVSDLTRLHLFGKVSAELITEAVKKTIIRR